MKSNVGICSLLSLVIGILIGFFISNMYKSREGFQRRLSEEMNLAEINRRMRSNVWAGLKAYHYNPSDQYALHNQKTECSDIRKSPCCL